MSWTTDFGCDSCGTTKHTENLQMHQSNNIEK